MAKLTLNAAKAAVGTGAFAEETITFRDSKGAEFEGEILVKRLSHDETITAVDAWDLEDRKTATIDQITKAIIFKAISRVKITMTNLSIRVSMLWYEFTKPG